MLEGKVSEKDIQIKNEILKVLEQRRASYGSVLVQAALSKRDETWKNIFTKIVPLHRSQKHSEKKPLDYGNFLLKETTVEIDEFKEMLEEIVHKGKLIIKNCPPVKIEGTLESGDYYVKHLPSNIDVYDLRWPTNFYYLNPKDDFKGDFIHEPLLRPDLPYFPDSASAILSEMGLNLGKDFHLVGRITFLLPNYKVKIDDLKINAKQLVLSIKRCEIGEEEVLGKIFLRKENDTRHHNLIFGKENTQTIPLEFIPDYIQFHLITKEGEHLDYRRINLLWPTPQKGVTIEITTDEIRELLKRGENEKVEFKQEISKDRKELLETFVSFANTQGGIILLGVDKNGEPVGITNAVEKKDTITSLIRSHCEPFIKVEFEIRDVDGKTILIIQVPEGENPPYNLRDKGFYIRAGSTDKIIKRDEIDQLYDKKSQRRQHPFV